MSFLPCEQIASHFKRRFQVTHLFTNRILALHKTAKPALLLAALISPDMTASLAGALDDLRRLKELIPAGGNMRAGGLR